MEQLDLFGMCEKVSDLEEFVDIPGYGGRYAINKLGEVVSRQGGKEYKLVRYEHGVTPALRVGLYRNGKREMKYVHRIVAEMFIENPRGRKYVTHIDGDKTNPHYKNLEWK